MVVLNISGFRENITGSGGMIWKKAIESDAAMWVILTTPVYAPCMVYLPTFLWDIVDI